MTASKGNERKRNAKKDEEDGMINESLSDNEPSSPSPNSITPPFLPLEATAEAPPTAAKMIFHRFQEFATKNSKLCSGKKIVSMIMFGVIGLVIWDAVFTDPQNRVFKPDFADTFLRWVQGNPIKGVFAFLIVIASAVVVMIPIGTPLTLGCGYIYKAAYGWTWGLALATFVSMGGSALGAVVCFLLGRYLMRDQVRLWIRKYPLFDAIDVAAAEHGLRIMAMLYLTPILPLGPVSYMCGTTSMALRSFVLAKIASLPLMLLYVFIGASTGALLSTDPNSAATEFKSIEENQTLIISGILMSFLMIGGITHFIKKELDKILDRQKKNFEKEVTEDSGEEGVMEMGVSRKSRKTPRHRRAG